MTLEQLTPFLKEAVVKAAGDGWIGVDLDGTLAKFTSWKGVNHIGAPVPKMVNRVKRWLASGKDVRIFTARAASGKKAITPIKNWCKDNLGKALPVTNVKTPDMVELYDDRAREIIKNTGEKRAAPTPAQAEAGNYKKKHVSWNGLRIAIETRKGCIRKGKDWRVKMPADYGYIKGTVGRDGDQVDVYLGPNLGSPVVHVVNQKNLATNKFDEHKCMLGFPSKAEALKTYASGFSDGKGSKRCMSVKSMSLATFKQWLASAASTQKKASV